MLAQRDLTINRLPFPYPLTQRSDERRELKLCESGRDCAKYFTRLVGSSKTVCDDCAARSYGERLTKRDLQIRSELIAELREAQSFRADHRVADHGRKVLQLEANSRYAKWRWQLRRAFQERKTMTRETIANIMGYTNANTRRMAVTIARNAGLNIATVGLDTQGKKLYRLVQ